MFSVLTASETTCVSSLYHRAPPDETKAFHAGSIQRASAPLIQAATAPTARAMNATIAPVARAVAATSAARRSQLIGLSMSSCFICASAGDVKRTA